MANDPLDIMRTPSGRARYWYVVSFLSGDQPRDSERIQEYIRSVYRMYDDDYDPRREERIAGCRYLVELVPYE